MVETSTMTMTEPPAPAADAHVTDEHAEDVRLLRVSLIIHAQHHC